MCYAISSNKLVQNSGQASFDQIEEHYIHNKYNIRSEAFIEYVAAEKAWVPIDAPSYMLINLFWTSDKYREADLGEKLYSECLKDAEGMNGIAVVVGKQRQPFLSDKAFFKSKGFKLADMANPYFELWYKPFIRNAPIPTFKSQAKQGKCEVFKGISIYYSSSYPVTEEYLNKEVKRICAQKGIPLKLHRIESRLEARSHCVPNTIYSVFYDGTLVGQHILNDENLDLILTSE